MRFSSARLRGGIEWPDGIFKARIGWFYNDDSAFPQTHAGPLVLHWAPCAKAGGVQIAFPTGAHLYEGENGNFSVKKPPIALLSGPPLNPNDPFKAILYVGDLAQPGTPSITLSSPALATPFATLLASDAEGAFEGLVKPSKEEPPGEYETVVSCGSGRVGVGIIGVH